MSWQKIVGTLAPTVATALGGPLAGAAFSALGGILGITDDSPKAIEAALLSNKLTPEQVTKIKELELQYQNEERERDFRYADLEFKDRDSARQANSASGMQNKLFYLGLVLLVMCLGVEGYILFNGLPTGLPDIVIGRVLGLLDGVAMLVLSYWYGSSNGSAQKNEYFNKESR